MTKVEIGMQEYSSIPSNRARPAFFYVCPRNRQSTRLKHSRKMAATADTANPNKVLPQGVAATRGARLLMTSSAVDDARQIFLAATPVIRISSLGDRRWKRAVSKGPHAGGPFLRARYKILDETAWEALKPYLYLVAGDDQVILYAGISRNRLQDRWHLFNGYDAGTGAILAGKQLFHRECWPHFEGENATSAESAYEVRCIDGKGLTQVLQRLGLPLSDIGVFGRSDASVISGVERWMSRSVELAPWNRSMAHS